jgi:hypothetical protein
MKPARIDWKHRTNEQFKFRVLLQKGDATPLDLSVYDDLVLQVKADALQPEPDLELSLGAGIALESGGSNGAINGVCAVEFIADMIGLYVYDVRATAAGGVSDVVLEGTIDFVQGVTV